MDTAAKARDRVRQIGGTADPIDALRAVRRHWRLAVLVALGLPLLSLGALSRMRPVYTATGTLLYNPVDFNPKLLRGVVETRQVTDALMASQAAILKSPAVVARVIDGLDLRASPEFDPARQRPSLLRRWLGSAGPPLPVAPDALRDAVTARFHIDVPAGSQLINVSFTAHDPALAARAANAAMAAYLARERRESLAVLDRAQAWLGQRAKATAHRLEALDVAIARERARSGTVRGAGAAPLTNEEAGQLTGSLAAARADLAAARARLRR